MSGRRHIKLAAFDLDGTLLRGDTVCEAIANGIGQLGRMRQFETLRAAAQIEEVKAARNEMAAWYAPYTVTELCTHLPSLALAPGAQDGLKLLRGHNFKIAIVSITWEFAVEWFCRRLGADYFVGTRLSSNGQITHFWPDDKPRWLQELALNLDIDLDEVVAVGDSSGDIPMLRAVGHPYWVGHTVPMELETRATHHPNGDIRLLAQGIVNSVLS